MKIVKTIKMFADGKFIRSESGRSFAFENPQTQKPYARLCQASRKDLRNTVEIAKTATDVWSSRTAFNRSQILYRMAEMAEGKRVEFTEIFQNVLGMSAADAHAELDRGIDAFVYYAGFCDKFQQITGAVNPINGPFHNFTTPDATGVVMHIESDDFSFAKLIDTICSILVGGNSVITLLGKGCPVILAPLAEVFATSDLPAGVVNLLTGDLQELHEFIGGHREIRGIAYEAQDQKTLAKIKELGADNMKRVFPASESELSYNNIIKFVEQKSIWHPIGF